MKRLERFDHVELQLAEANFALAELRKAGLQQNANVSNLIGELAKVRFEHLYKTLLSANDTNDTTTIYSCVDCCS